MKPERLDRRSLRKATRELTARDARLAEIVARYGVPPLWERQPGFPTLCRIILEQQVSLASGAAMFERLSRELPGGVGPSSVRAAGEPGLRNLGVTRQKARYLVALARGVEAGDLPLARLAHLPDDKASELLMKMPGIGAWTASVYLLMALRRPDIWPAGDLALVRSAGAVLDLPRSSTPAEIAKLAARWSPWRAVAARILWLGYLSGGIGRIGRRPVRLPAAAQGSDGS